MHIYIYIYMHMHTHMQTQPSDKVVKEAFVRNNNLPNLSLRYSDIEPMVAFLDSVSIASDLRLTLPSVRALFLWRSVQQISSD